MKIFWIFKCGLFFKNINKVSNAQSIKQKIDSTYSRIWKIFSESEFRRYSRLLGLILMQGHIKGIKGLEGDAWPYQGISPYRECSKGPRIPPRRMQRRASRMHTMAMRM